MPTREEKAKASMKGLRYALLSVIIGLAMAIGFTNKYIPESNMFVGLFLWYVFSVISRRIINWAYSEEVAKIREIVFAPEDDDDEEPFY